MNTTAPSILGFLLAAVVSAAAAQGAPEAANSEAQGEPVSRSEVLADLLVWQRAGMPALVAGDSGPDLNSNAYRQAHARYMQLRNSPEFAQIVARIAQERGEKLTIATK
jgi:hypothetical protein